MIQFGRSKKAANPMVLVAVNPMVLVAVRTPFHPNADSIAFYIWNPTSRPCRERRAPEDKGAQRAVLLRLKYGRVSSVIASSQPVGMPSALQKPQIGLEQITFDRMSRRCQCGACRQEICLSIRAGWGSRPFTLWRALAAPAGTVDFHFAANTFAGV